MLIDWFTVVAQIINFLILVYILKRFLFGRIIRAIDEREKRIASRLEEAEHKREEAEREAEFYHKKNKEFEAKREEMFSRVREEAEEWRKELMRKARSEADQIQARWKEAIRQEEEAFLRDLRQQVSKQTFVIARRALADLANTTLEKYVIDVFVDRLQEQDQSKWKLISGPDGKMDKAVIHSAFEIPVEVRNKIIDILHSQISADLDVYFEKSHDLICGIELKLNGYKVVWSFQDYLETLEDRISAVLEEETEGKVLEKAETDL